MIVGGCGTNNNNNYNLKLWEAVITEESDNLQFKAVDVTPVKPRSNPICFKLRDNVYIAGGQVSSLENNCIDCCTGDDRKGKYSWHHLCCDRYNVKERKYVK